MSGSAARYLSRYGAEEHVLLPDPPGDLPPRTLIVPIYAEAADCLQTVLADLPVPVCVIAVVNAPVGAPSEHLETTRRFLDQFAADQRLSWHAVETEHCTHPLLLVDRVRAPLPAKQGVGGARRIGMDLGLALSERQVSSARILHTTDADARLPAAYFQAGAANGLLLYPFRHASDHAPTLQRARAYEAHMHHYRQGLQQAGSPYGFTALGSCMAVCMDTYVKVRGMPRRDGGEDFHFANKAAKVADVHTLRGPTIQLSARTSHRVPFGTGPTLDRMGDNPGDFLTYSPESFTGLKQLLTTFEQPSPLTGWVGAACEQLGVQAAISRLSAQYPEEKRARALHTWFDGLKTLRFIHLARDVHPDVPVRTVAAWRTT